LSFPTYHKERFTMTTKVSVAPSARRLTRSLRDIGYSFESAIADLVDNSIAADATKIKISIVFDGKASSISLIDNGNGMNAAEIDEAMRFGSRRSYRTGELGRYGLGLKTATLSQAKRLEVVSVSKEASIPVARTLDLDFINATDRWEVLDASDEPETERSLELLPEAQGTVIVWKKLDRLLPVKSPEGGWARRRIEGLADKLTAHLSMVFHRFLEGVDGQKITIEINDVEVEPWDPFVRSELETQDLGVDEFEIEQDGQNGKVRLHRFLLPSKEEFSSLDAFNAASGPERWNKQQGIYIYRANRLVQWGGWAGIRTIDEHLKLARCVLEFGTDLDEAFNINVAKMRVSLPAQLKKMMTRPIEELCIEANAAYRRSARCAAAAEEAEQIKETTSMGSSESGATIGLAIKTAAARTGNYDALKAITKLLREEMPEVAKHLGL
jgi:hypothetical protein